MVQVIRGSVGFHRLLRKAGTLQSWLGCAEVGPRTHIFQQEKASRELLKERGVEAGRFGGLEYVWS